MPTPKAQLRSRLLATRSGMSPSARAVASEALARHLLTTTEVSDASVVAGYVGVGSEPSTLGLLSTLRGRGVRVLLPVLLGDDDLDWAEFTTESELVPAGRGLLEPAGPRLGVDALSSADVLLVPGLAVGGDGVRLGRGGGSYDRALARIAPAPANAVPVRPWTCVLLFDQEILAAVPADAHDRAVAAAVTPSGVTRFTR